MSSILKILKNDISMNLDMARNELNQLIKTRVAHTSLDGQMAYDDEFDSKLSKEINKKMKDIEILENLERRELKINLRNSTPIIDGNCIMWFDELVIGE